MTPLWLKNGLLRLSSVRLFVGWPLGLKTHSSTVSMWSYWLSLFVHCRFKVCASQGLGLKDFERAPGPCVPANE